MSIHHLTKAEQRLMDLIWNHGTIPSGDLVRECDSLFAWKKSTTYTNLKKLIEKEMVSNCESVVAPLISKTEYKNLQKREAIRLHFSDSLPQFLLTFFREEKLSKSDIEELERMIDAYKEELNE